MNYIEIKYPKPNDEISSELLVSDLGDIGFESFAEEDEHTAAYIPEKEFLLERLLDLSFFQELHSQGLLTINLIEDQNWNALWESNYPAVLVAERCFIRAPFHKENEQADYNILIKPKMAFGTAHHETTAMMLELLLNIDVQDKTVMDMGCGTGVLAILASLKGASKITAIDFDEWAFSNTLENVEANGCTNIETIQGDANSIPDDMTYDLFIANINKNTLLKDKAVYHKSIVSGGMLFLSGFYESDIPDITQEAKKNGLIFVSGLTKNKWTSAVYSKQ